MTDPKKISISDYHYDLPDSKIALAPLKERDASRLMVFQKGQRKTDLFRNIANHLPKESLLVFNNSKVINARLRFKKQSGSTIEIFCLEPAGNITEYSTVMNQTVQCEWKCLVGGASRWKESFLEKEINIGGASCNIKASIVEKQPEAWIIRFQWNPVHFNFAEILEVAGDIPLPPYIKRNTTTEDADRYQTIYAQNDGSVAAPTAGLHFSDNVFKSIEAKKINKINITLHVGAGTFKPVKAATMNAHEMHAEWIDAGTSSIEAILNQNRLIVAVGTTSLRTLETLYWLGVKASLHPESEALRLNQWEIYEAPFVNTSISKEQSLTALLHWMQARKMNRIFTQTQLLITPGYTFRIAKALITNFHQPQSTLLLLVAAAIGDQWKENYQYALENDFRFLSYGDSNLIFMAE